MKDSIKKFATDRSRYLRTTELSKMDEWAVGQIEEHGCAIISVGSDCKDDFGWSYSLGVLDYLCSARTNHGGFRTLRSREVVSK